MPCMGGEMTLVMPDCFPGDPPKLPAFEFRMWRSSMPEKNYLSLNLNPAVATREISDEVTPKEIGRARIELLMDMKVLLVETIDELNNAQRAAEEDQCPR